MTGLRGLVGDYLAFVFESDPIEATRVGMHDYDHLLGEYAPDAIDDIAQGREDFLSRFEAIDLAELEADEQMDVDWRSSISRLP